jgi:hypothetical protein
MPSSPRRRAPSTIDYPTATVLLSRPGALTKDFAQHNATATAGAHVCAEHGQYNGQYGDQTPACDASQLNRTSILKMMRTRRIMLAALILISRPEPARSLIS